MNYTTRIWAICLAICGWYVSHAQDLSTESFSDMLRTLNTTPQEDRTIVVESHNQAWSTVPRIAGGTVIFLAKGDHRSAPILLADFNGFLNPRYVSDPLVKGKMTAIDGSNWYYRRELLRPDAAIYYQFRTGEKTYTDPLNPNVHRIFGNLRSYLEMPEFQAERDDYQDPFGPRGHVLSQTLFSQSLGHERSIQIYVPTGYDSRRDEALPSVYFHDGDFYIQNGRIPALLDALIASKRMAPIIAVFDNPVIRGKEYRGDVDFRTYIHTELIPHIERTFDVSSNREHRAVIGGSRGGLSALYLSFGSPAVGMCGALSPAVHPKAVPDLLAELRSYGHQPSVLWITGSVYDHIWYEDARQLNNALGGTVDNLHYKEIAAGHNIPAWRSLLDDMLTTFFPL